MTLKDLGRSVGNALYRQVGRANSRVQSYRSLPVDILEDDNTYRVVFDAPGAEPDDVQVRYLEGTVRIRIDRFRQFHEGHEMRFPGRGMALSGEAELPADAVVDPDAGTAKLSETGTLAVEIPKDSAVRGTETTDAAVEVDSPDEPSSDASTETEPVALDD
ncbi:Hsp20/alpha crystallin family protein [Natrinema marinum]|uniref:Hsp20/alpha crystallin family protein n=1 Tax=Natrinema marinum TaxID=2961598 RepID=UPI0020C85EF0|nr:Hsp20/alpha crystallin family protein [Natrinema marinum]